MTEANWISERDLAAQIARAYYLRTGHLLKTEVFLPEIQRKFNHNHDPSNGQFTFGPGPAQAMRPIPARMKGPE